MAGSIKDLSRYRYERSSEELENAKAMLETGKYKLALNRSYYSIFHGMRAVNVLDEFDSSKHSGVIAHFNQYHVKTGDFLKKHRRSSEHLLKCVNMLTTKIFSLLPARMLRNKFKKLKHFMNLLPTIYRKKKYCKAVSIPFPVLTQNRTTSSQGAVGK